MTGLSFRMSQLATGSGTAATDESRRDERAAILVLFAILITVIVIFVALVIDTSRIASGSRQKSHSSDLVAMSFLEGYLNALPDSIAAFNANGSQQAAFRAGLVRAAETGALNFLTANRATTAVRSEYQQLTQSGDLFAGGYNNQGNRGHVRVGKWFSSKPAALANCNPARYQSIDFEDPNNKCPCVRPRPNKPFGCFVACDNDNGCRNPLDATDTQYQPGNAARVDLYSDPSGVTNVKLLFGRIAGPASRRVDNSGIASVKNRQGVVVMDLSRSTTADTHYQSQKTPDNAAGQFAAEYSYKCLPGGPTAMSDGSGAWELCAGGVLDNPNAAPVGYTTEAAYADSWGATYTALAANVGYSPWCAQQDRHCQRDYRFVQVFSSGTAGGPAPEDYLVEIGFTDAPGIGVPKIGQPHTGILAATHAALDLMHQKRIGGDAVGFIGFDRQVDTDLLFTKTNRYIPPTPIVRVGDAKTNYAGASDFQKMLDFTDPDPANRLFRAQHNIFPRQEEFADLPLAIWHAHNMLKTAAGAEDAIKFIVVVTSNLTSCARSGADRDSPLGKIPVCGRSYDLHQQSLDEMFNFRVKGTTTSQLEGDGVILHSVLVGSQVAPHRIFVKKFGGNPPGCLTEAEMRRANLYTTLPSSGYAASMAAYDLIGKGDPAAPPYLDAAFWLSAAARQVGGLWVPVNINSIKCSGTVPACTNDDNGDGIPDYSMEREINQACASMGTPAAAPPYPAPAYPAGTGALAVPGPTLAGFGVPLSGVDPQGRMFCDVNCSERLQAINSGDDAIAQVQKGLAELYQTPPVSLVGGLGD
jgi:hypothetical protein